MDDVLIQQIAILGAGAMGEIIVDSLLAHSLITNVCIRTTNLSKESAQRMRDGYGVRALAVATDAEANQHAVAGAGLVIVAVEPHRVVAVLREIEGVLRPGATVVSLAAGVTTAVIERYVPPGVHVVRVNPNTPARIGQGVVGIAAGESADQTSIALVRRVFAPMGATVDIAETRMDLLSAISGSGPAYMFYVVEQLTNAAVALGFPHDEAVRLVNATFSGSGALLRSADLRPEQLRRQVTSAGGITEKAIEVLAAANLARTFEEAIQAAVRHAQALATGA